MTPKILVDTDPGVDDDIAIFMALASPELNVVGPTTVVDNAVTNVTTRNALVLLEAAGRTDISVAVGESKPMAGDYLGPVSQVHGPSGLGGTEPLEHTGSPTEADAAAAPQSGSAQPWTAGECSI